MDISQMPSEIILPVEDCVAYMAHGLNLVSLHVAIEGGSKFILATAHWTCIHLSSSLIHHLDNTTGMCG